MNISLKDAVYEIAHERGVSVRQMEKDLGWADRSVAKWDKNRPSIDKIEAVADYLSVSIDEMIGRVTFTDAYEMELRRKLFETPGAKALLDAASGCTPEELETLVGMISVWKKSSSE